MNDEWKRKISETLKRKYKNGEIINPLKGKKRPEMCGQNNPAKRLEVRKKISKAKKGKKMSEKHKNKLSEVKLGKPNLKLRGRKRPDICGENNPAKRPEVRKKISENNPMKRPEIRKKMSGKNHPNYGTEGYWKGRKHSEESKLKMRISTIEYIKKVNKTVRPMIGKNETRILDELELSLNYKIIRQYFVCGYFLDGYIPELNLVIEVDESYHKYKIKRDVKRQQNIIDELGCQFIRIKDNFSTI